MFLITEKKRGRKALFFCERMLVMANYYSTCRTNYFRVKDMKKFESFLSECCFEDFELCKEKNGTVCILCSNSWPSCRKPDYEDMDFFEEIKAYLKAGEVAVFMEVGSEKHRYLQGVALAVIADKPVISVSIDDIYSKASKEFGVKVNRISEAIY